MPPNAPVEAGKTDTSKPAPLSWRSMLTSPSLWALSGMYFCNAGWSFFASWITPYLQRDLHMSGLTLVLASGGPLFFGGIACMLGGGKLTDRQVQIWGRRWGRTLQGVIAYGFAGVLLIVAVLATKSNVLLAYSICLSSFVKDFGIPSSWATTIDIGHRYSGTVAGFMNTVGNLGQVLTIPIVAELAVMAETPGSEWSVSLYYYSAMFFTASVAWLVVDPRRVIVYSKADQVRLGLNQG